MHCLQLSRLALAQLLNVLDVFVMQLLHLQLWQGQPQACICCCPCIGAEPHHSEAALSDCLQGFAGAALFPPSHPRLLYKSTLPHNVPTFTSSSLRVRSSTALKDRRTASIAFCRACRTLVLHLSASAFISLPMALRPSRVGLEMVRVETTMQSLPRRRRPQVQLCSARCGGMLLLCAAPLLASLWHGHNHLLLLHPCG